MAKDKKTTENSTPPPAGTRNNHQFNDDIRFVVPMPGRSAWHSQHDQPTFKKLHTFSKWAGDCALEDYQAQFLMQREYLID